MARGRMARSMAILLVFVLLTSLTAFGDTVGKQDILQQIEAENIMGHIAALSPGDDARIAGSIGEKEAARYIKDIFESYGLKVEKPEFDTILFHDEGAELQISNPANLVLDHEPLNMEYTVAGDVTAELVYVGLGGADDYTGKDVKGKIALIKRGEYTFSEKVANAAAAGATGAILFNNILEEGFIHGTLGETSAIPAMEIHPADGEKIAALLESGTPVNVGMVTKGYTEDVTSQNVIGTLYADDQNNNTPTIVIGAHYDSVDTPGANDNASGTATMLEVARVMSQRQYNANIKFIAFGAEEVGLVGAYDFVEDLSKAERQKIAAMINMDMVGVGDTVGIWTIGDKGSKVLANLAENYTVEAGLAINKGVEDRSDHAAFAENNIPSVYFSYETDPNYHTDEDVIGKIDPKNVGNICRIVTEMSYDMAEAPMLQSTQGFNGVVNQYRHINPNKLQQ